MSKPCISVLKDESEFPVDFNQDVLLLAKISGEHDGVEASSLKGQDFLDQVRSGWLDLCKDCGLASPVLHRAYNHGFLEGIAFNRNEHYQEYQQLLIKLHILIVEGRNQSSDVTEIRNAMEREEQFLSEDEIIRINDLSEYLSILLKDDDEKLEI